MFVMIQDRKFRSFAERSRFPVHWCFPCQGMLWNNPSESNFENEGQNRASDTRTKQKTKVEMFQSQGFKGMLFKEVTKTNANIQKNDGDNTRRENKIRLDMVLHITYQQAH